MAGSHPCVCVSIDDPAWDSSCVLVCWRMMFDEEPVSVQVLVSHLSRSIDSSDFPRTDPRELP